MVHETLHANLLDMILQAMGIFHTEEQRSFRSRNRALFDQLRGQSKPLESLAPNILEAIYDGRPWNDKWETLLWHMAQHYKFWLVVPPAPGWLVQDEDGSWVSSSLECLEEATDVRFPDSKGNHIRIRAGFQRKNISERTR